MNDSITRGDVEIVTYRPEFAKDFALLNYEWLEKYFTVEPLDEEYLSDPEGHIMQLGGEIFFALDGNRVIGTCAAIPRDDGTMELAKLAVTPDAQGRGLGRALSVAVIEFARSRQPKNLYLVSSTRLAPALRLYETLGFRHLPFPWPPPYTDADVYMELDVSHASA